MQISVKELRRAIRGLKPSAMISFEADGKIIVSDSPPDISKVDQREMFSLSERGCAWGSLAKIYGVPLRTIKWIVLEHEKSEEA